MLPPTPCESQGGFRQRSPPFCLYTATLDFLAEPIKGDVIFHLWKVRGRISIDTSIRNYLSQYDSQKAYALFKHRVARKQNEQKRRNHMCRVWYAAASIVVLLIISSLIYIGAGYPY